MIKFIIDLWRSNIIIAATKLDVFDYLAIRPMTAEELAEQTDTHAASLYRLLRALASLNYVEKIEKKRFQLTPKGQLLRNDVPYCVKHCILGCAADTYEIWEKLPKAVKTGKMVDDSLFGQDHYGHMKNHEEELENFAKANAELTLALCPIITEIYDFSRFKHIVDVAGGNGAFLSLILAKAQNAKGTLFEVGPMIELAKRNLAKTSVKDRCFFEKGNFLESVPAGGDCYIIKNALANHDDEALKVLENVRKQMKSGTIFLLCQAILPEINKPHIAWQTDLLFFMVVNGVERTEEDWLQLISKAGLKLNKITRIGYFYDIMEILL
ncbi:methyltransferase-like protein [Dinothrombium tinctorium]|uniref:Acetylserotonin O-methyltransferase n=1 Tax=Dinothrombium tinctorium TaxID=1965070 RepID=A0A3S3NR15_9ACAR|nr:methyltransferase-like protein [Dinothrombium tinctorium]RWS02576.1 methyltransferase-like protein [Dinothrombium tinctorium]RWS04379.1 methyltransferase-like protein [Dinothrombium tinctorium]